MLWADTATHRRLPDLTLLGQLVHLRITFTRAHWTYGAGASADKSTPSRPYTDSDPCQSAQCADYDGHTYYRTGTVTVTLTTTWHADYQLAGGAWQAIDEPVTAPPSRTTLTIRQARGVIVH